MKHQEKQRSKHKRPGSALLTLLLALALVISGCGQAQESDGSPAQGGAQQRDSEAKQPEKISIGVTSTTFGLPLHVAKVKGFFEQYGIDAQLTTYSFGIDTLNALVTSQEQFGMAMDFAALSRAGKGGFRLVAVTASPHADDQMLFVNENIDKPADLKGKRIGTQRGTVNEYIWYRYLEENGIDPSEVTIEYLTSNAELYAAFAKGDLDAIWMNKAFEDKMLAIEGAKNIADLNAIQFRSIGLVAVDEQIIQEKPELVENFLRAIADSNRFIQEHPEEAAEIGYQEMKVPKDALLKEITFYDFDVRFLQEDFNQLQGIKDWATDAGLFTDQYELKEVLYLDAVEKRFPGKVTYQAQPSS